MTTSERALSFGAAAELYDQIRPTYPRSALRWALGTEAAKVVDLGAGTGILSRALHEMGHDVVPVEPDAQMRARLKAVTPVPNPLDGDGEHIPVNDHSVDAVVAGQSYHWFRTEEAHAEIARVLKPGGVFAPIWNLLDEDYAWVAHLSQAADLHQGGSANAAGLVDTFGPMFTEPVSATFEHSTPLTPEDLLRLVHSHSPYLASAPERQTAIDAEVRDLVQHHPDLAGRDTFELPYVTTVYRARYER